MDTLATEESFECISDLDDDLLSINHKPSNNKRPLTTAQSLGRATKADTQDESEDEDNDVFLTSKPIRNEVGEHLKTDIEWSSLGLSKPLLRALKDLGFTHPTPIQRDTIPPALAGHDVLGMAETGSGKTAAFLLPALERLLQSPIVRKRRLGPDGEIRGAFGATATKVLIMLPTRELAMQCYNVCVQLTKYAPITKCLLCGGFSVRDQEQEIKKVPDVVITTPGRCLDLLLNSSNVHMDLLDIVIFDESDRLVELGFRDTCLSVLKHCSNDRQTLLFSATLSAQGKELSRLALKRPVRVPVDNIERESKTAEQITNKFIDIQTEEERLPCVFHILDEVTTKNFNTKIVVFFNTKKAAHKAFLLTQLCELRLPLVCELHGNLPQQERTKSVKDFTKGDRTILFCTDLAARGLDLTDVDLVINAEVPSDATKFIHRIGRTGRAGKEGEAITVLNQNKERSEVREIFKKTKSKEKSFKTESFSHKVGDKFVKMLDNAMPRVKNMLAAESAERELRKAETIIQANENKEKHHDEIMARPKKQWIKKRKTD